MKIIKETMFKKIFLFLLLEGVFCSNALPADLPYGKLFTGGSGKEPVFALTYDDGPGVTTPILLKLLAKYDAKATFFMLGCEVVNFPEYAKEVNKAGHLIGNHTYGHIYYYTLTGDREKKLYSEIERADDSIEKATGVKPLFLRMPNGYSRAWTRKVIANTGHVMVNWTYGSDWEKLPLEEMLKGYLGALRPGAILLFHDGSGKVRQNALLITEKVLEEAKKKNLKAVRLDELLGFNNAASSDSRKTKEATEAKEGKEAKDAKEKKGGDKEKQSRKKQDFQEQECPLSPIPEPAAPGATARVKELQMKKTEKYLNRHKALFQPAGSDVPNPPLETPATSYN